MAFLTFISVTLGLVPYARLAEDAPLLRDRHAARRAGRHPRRALLADDHVIAAEEDNVAGPVEAADAERLFLDLSGLRGPRCEASRHLARDGLGRGSTVVGTRCTTPFREMVRGPCGVDV